MVPVYLHTKDLGDETTTVLIDTRFARRIRNVAMIWGFSV